MKYCTNCGAQLSDDAKFCSVCGTKQEVVKAAAPPKPKRPAAPKQTTHQSPKSKTLEGNQEEFFTASDTAGEVVLSSWENPKPKAEASANTREQPPRQNYQQPPQQHYQQPQQNYQQPPRQNYQQQPQQSYQQPPQQNYQQAAAPQKKKRGFFSWLLIIFLIIMTLYFLGQILGGCKNINLPPDPGTPEPEPLSGVFVCGNDTLFFNGDGKSVSWHFAINGTGCVPIHAKDLGFPLDSGTYAFLFSHGKVRYDVAERLFINKVINGDTLQTTMTLAKPASDTLISVITEGGTVADFRKVSNAYSR